MNKILKRLIIAETSMKDVAVLMLESKDIEIHAKGIEMLGAVKAARTWITAIETKIKENENGINNRD